MKQLENSLGKQLILLVIIIFNIVLITLGVVLPRALAPIYEKSIYNALGDSLDAISEEIEYTTLSKSIGFLYITEEEIYFSPNFSNIIPINKNDLLLNVKEEKGKFLYKDKIYYYYVMEDNSNKKIAVTEDSSIAEIKRNIMGATLPVLIIAFVLVSLITFIWSNILVKKIAKVKQKVDNIDNDNFNHKVDFRMEDEITMLAKAIEDMRISLKNQENYKNQMYQNISHDFKTPLTVIKSYVEAVNDGVETKENALKVIDEQTLKLEKKVHSLLSLNKLDYLKDKAPENKEEIDISEVITSATEKFKYQRKDINFSLSIDNSKFYGTFDLWETIIDNILNNFMRYALKEIKITVKNNKLTLYNDGPNIDEEFLTIMFSPYRKGIKGEFGLGLSIVKKTLNLLNYDIVVKNHSKKGVSFIISKGL